MNVEFLKSLLLPIIKEKKLFSVDIVSDEETNKIKVSLNVSGSDIKKIIGYSGRVYRSVRTLLRYKFKNASLELLVNITNKKVL